LERPLTSSQRRVLDAIVAAWLSGGPLPTTRELCAALGWRSTNSAAEHLDRLVARGALRRDGARRSYGINLDNDHVRTAARLARAAVRLHALGEPCAV